MKKIGILNGGGDCPGLNAVIRAVVRRGAQLSFQTLGIKWGWAGLLERDYEVLDLKSVSGILHRGGTILGTSRTNPFKDKDGGKRIKDNFSTLALHALVVVGGEDTLGVALKVHELGLPVVGIPKTIDNDLAGTDLTFGFDTAVSIATEAIDRLHTTAESHNRVIVVEVMGRGTGWIATFAGLAGGADVILIPEKPIQLDKVCELIGRRHARGKDFSIVVVAEGAKIEGQETVKASKRKDAFGHEQLGGIGQTLAQEIESRCDFETRVTVLGHVQRGGGPTAFDRILATRFGVFATDMVDRGEFGKMAALRGNRIESIPLAEAVQACKTVDPEIFKMAEVFFG